MSVYVYACHLLDGWTFFLVYQFVGTESWKGSVYDQLHRYASEYEELQLAVPCRKKEQESNWEKGLQVGIWSAGKLFKYGFLHIYVYVLVDRWLFVQKSSLDKWHHFKYKHLYIFQNVKTRLFPTNWSLLQLNTFFVVGWLCRPCIACIRYPEKVRMVDWLVATEGATGGSKRIDKKHEVCLFNGKTNHFCCDLSLQLEICNF